MKKDYFAYITFTLAVALVVTGFFAFQFQKEREMYKGVNAELTDTLQTMQATNERLEAQVSELQTENTRQKEAINEVKRIAQQSNIQAAMDSMMQQHRSTFLQKVQPQTSGSENDLTGLIQLFSLLAGL